MNDRDTGLTHGTVATVIARRFHDAGHPGLGYLAGDIATAVTDLAAAHAAKAQARAAARARHATARVAACAAATGAAVTSLTGLSSAFALTSLLVLLGMAALAGWLLRALVGDEEAVAVADQQRAYARVDRADAAAARAALDDVAAVLRGDGHGEHLYVDASGARSLTCPVCVGPCRYGQALRPPVPALNGTPPEPVPGLPRQARRRHRRAGAVTGQ